MSVLVKRHTLLSVILMLFSNISFAEPSSLQGLRFKTQHDVPVSPPQNIQYVLFSHDMNSKDLVSEAINDKNEGFLSKLNTVYIANISGMPRIIARMFAYPAMRKQKYDIWLDEVGEKTAGWAREEGKVTLYSINNLQVTAIEFIDSPDTLLSRISQPPPSPTSVTDSITTISESDTTTSGPNTEPAESNTESFEPDTVTTKSEPASEVITPAEN